MVLSNMIYIVALSVGLKCPRKIHLNTQWGGGGGRLFPLHKYSPPWVFNLFTAQAEGCHVCLHNFITEAFNSRKNFNWTFLRRNLLKSSSVHSYGNTGCGVFKQKLEIFLPKNHYTQRKLLNFEFWINGELSKSAKICLSKSIFYICQKSSKSFSIFFH